MLPWVLVVFSLEFFFVHHYNINSNKNRMAFLRIVSKSFIVFSDLLEINIYSLKFPIDLLTPLVSKDFINL